MSCHSQFHISFLNRWISFLNQITNQFQVDSDTDGEPTSPLQDASNRAAAPVMSMEDIKSGVSSPDPAVQFAAVQSARKILSRERNPPIEALIATGTIPRFVEFLGAADKPKLQFEVRLLLDDENIGVFSIMYSYTVNFQLLPICIRYTGCVRRS